MTKPPYKHQFVSPTPEEEPPTPLSQVLGDDEPEAAPAPAEEPAAAAAMSDEDGDISDRAGNGLFVDVVEEG